MARSAQRQAYRQPAILIWGAYVGQDESGIRVVKRRADERAALYASKGGATAKRVFERELARYTLCIL